MKKVLGGAGGESGDTNNITTGVPLKPCTGTIVDVVACAMGGHRAQSTGSGPMDWECCI